MASSGIASSGGVRTGLTALAGGAAPTLAANTASVGTNVISTCTTTGDSFILPASTPLGARVLIAHTGTNTVDVFPNTGGTINAGTATTGQVGVATKTGATFTQVGTDGLTWVADNCIAAAT